MRILILLLLALWLAAPLQAQLKKTLHQTFELPDSATHLVFDLYTGNNYSIEPWAGNNIMTESQVRVYSSTQPVFNHLIENGRYKFEAHAGTDTFTLVSFDPRRLPIRAAGMQAFEEVDVRIFIPDSFTPISNTLYSRPRPEAPEVLVGKAPPVRKKLDRERGVVSEALKDSLQVPADSLELQPVANPPADSTILDGPGQRKGRKRSKN